MNEPLQFLLMDRAMKATITALERKPEPQPEEREYTEKEFPGWQRSMGFTDPDQAGGFISAQQ